MMELPTTFEGMMAFLQGLPDDEIRKLAKTVDPLLKAVWLPQPGTQKTAYDSDADELLYGGAVGGGKSDLLLGLALTRHQRSVIFRSQSKDLDGMWERLRELVPQPAQANDQKRFMRTPDGRVIEGGHLELPGSERAWMGRPHDLIGFDEAALLQEQRVLFVMNWLRSTDAKQRKRVVFATNPPLPEIKDGELTNTPVGDWLVRWFAPWVDPMYARPAQDGELRWCYMTTRGKDVETIWVDGPGYYDTSTGKRIDNPTKDDVDRGRVTASRSRTFIRSLLKDNAYLRGTGYAEKLSSIPEPMRSMLLNGDFTMKLADDAMQVIPTAWVLLAEERWRARRWEGDVERLRQLVLSCDIAQGGADASVITGLYETNYFEHPYRKPGVETPTGFEVESMLLAERQDNADIVLDGTGGWGGSTRDLLQQNHAIEAIMFIASGGGSDWTPDMMYRYENNRARMWWEFRLALDPRSGENICLPPDPRLRAQLTAPRFGVRSNVLSVESKDALRKRLGSSTDEADTILQAWQFRDRALARLLTAAHAPQTNRFSGTGRRHGDRSSGSEALPLADPRG